MARKILNFHIHDSDWMNFVHFSRYKYKTKSRLVSTLDIEKKRGSSIDLEIHHAKVSAPVINIDFQNVIFFSLNNKKNYDIKHIKF